MNAVSCGNSPRAMCKEASPARRGATLRDSKEFSSREKSRRGREGSFSQEESYPPPNSEGSKGALWIFPEMEGQVSQGTTWVLS